MTTADLDNNGKADLIASFPTYGVWAFRNFEAWSQVHALTAQRIAALHMDGGTQIDLVFDFGAAYGLWTYHNSSVWGQLHTLASQGLAVGDFDADGKDDLVVGFGGAGLWKYANGAWSQLHTSGPGGLAAGCTDVFHWRRGPSRTLVRLPASWPGRDLAASLFLPVFLS